MKNVLSMMPILVVASLSVGCGDDDGGGNGAGTPDAMASTPDAMATRRCTLLEESYGDLGSVTGEVLLRPVDDIEPNGPQYATLQIPLNMETPPDVLFVELWDGTKPFADGLVTGMFSLGGSQADLITCGACVYIAADVVEGENLKFHMSSSGMLNLDQLDATPGTGRVTGSLTSVSLRAVTIDTMGQAAVPDGCVTSIDAVAFDFAVSAP